MRLHSAHSGCNLSFAETSSREARTGIRAFPFSGITHLSRGKNRTLPGVDGLPRFSERLRTAVSDLAVKTCSGSVSTSVSIGGVVVDPGIQSSCDTLIQVADMALYCAKHGGRNRCVLLQADGGPYPDSNSTAQMPAPPDLASASPASIA